MDNNTSTAPAQTTENRQMEVLPPPSKDYISQAEERSLEFMNPKRWQVMQVMAQTFVNAGALPESINTAPKLIMVMQAGFEAGLQPLEAINSFYFVNGKLAMFGEMVIAQVKKAGHKIEWGKCDETEANVTITRGDTGEKMEAKFTMAMAEKRGLTMSKSGPKEVWRKFPDNMLKFKVFNSVAKFIVPDALHGVPMKEDLDDVEVFNEDGSKAAKTKKVVMTTAPEETVPAHKPLTDVLNAPAEKELAGVKKLK